MEQIRNLLQFHILSRCHRMCAHHSDNHDFPQIPAFNHGLKQIVLADQADQGPILFRPRGGSQNFAGSSVG